ncbi:MAG TPA: hypothetical protein VG291_11200, partial [Xanthobacteraceae bacterium]|nr:hypothetical protein [Xanthobacteraceae bacterium]
MSEELFAISKVPPAPAAQADYDSICAALMDTARGRWFLEEYARRNRSADTQLLLAAIQRIEAVVCAERNKQAQQGFRTDLLEMAKAITRTRAEVAEIKSDALHPESARPDTQPPPPPRTRDVFAAAERIRDVTWAMRGHGFDPSTCDQLEELAGTILSASSLRDPTDRRARKLSEVLQYLERRIDTLLESGQDGDAAAPEPTPAPGPGAEAGPANGFAGPIGTAEPELAAGAVEASLASPPSPPEDFHSVAVPMAADVELETEAEVEAEVEVEAEIEAEAEVEAEADAKASSSPAEVDMAPHALAPEPQPEPSVALGSEPQAVPPSVPGLTGTDAGLTPLPSNHPEGRPEPLNTTQDQDVGAQAAGHTTAAGAPPREALMPSLKLTHAGGLLPTSPDAQAAFMARWQAPARAFLPELDLCAQWPDFGAAPTGAGVLAASPPPEAPTALPAPAWLALEPATDFDGEGSTVPQLAEPSGLSPAPVVSQEPFSAQPADAADEPALTVDEPAPAEPAASALAPLLAVAAPTQLAADASAPQPP